MRKNVCFVLLLILFLANCSHAKHIYSERLYQKHWCDLRNGQVEYRLNDATRIDCLTDGYAVEFDFADKWAESIGQALYYSLSTDKKPGVVLILENQDKDRKYLDRLKRVADCYNIKIWTIIPEELNK